MSRKVRASLRQVANLSAVVGGCLGLVVFGSISTAGWASTVNEETTLRMDMETVELSTGVNGSNRDVVSFMIEGSEPRVVRLDVLDLALLEDGSKTLLPLASTGNTLKGVVTLSETAFRYVPNADSQTFSVDVVATEPLTQVAWGALRVSISPVDLDDQSLSSRSTSAIVRFVIVTPEGWDGQVPVIGTPGLEVGNMSVVSGARQNIIEQVLPDFPGVINRGPIIARVPMLNTSQAPSFVLTDWNLVSEDDVLLQRSSDRRLLLPAEGFDHEVDSMVQAPGSTVLVDVSPGSGRITVSSRTTLSLGGQDWAVHDRSRSVLIFRWKEPFALLLLVAVIVGLPMWGRRKDLLEAQKVSNAPVGHKSSPL